MRRLFTQARRWRNETAGAAVTEFALVLPVMILIWLGGYEVFNAVTIYRKVQDTTAQLANIASRLTTQTMKADVQADMAAAAQIMLPTSTANLQIVVTEIQTDASNNATVTWSQGYNGGSTYAKASAWTLPAALQVASTAYLLVQTTYNYSPTIGAPYIGSAAIPMTSQLYMSPRQVPYVPCPDC